MTTRFRATSAASVALICGLSLAAGGCGKYSYNNLKAIKVFKDANNFYRQKDYKRAADKYEQALKANPDLVTAYFFLGNSYDEQYKPIKKGDPENDKLMDKALEYYQKAAERETDPKMKKLALEYLVAAYGPEKLNDPSKAEPLINQIIQMEPNEPTNYFALSRLYQDAGKFDEAEAALMKAKEVKPSEPAVYTTMAGFYNAQGDFPKTIDALQQAADLNKKNPEGYHLIATYYEEKTRKDFRLSPAQQKEYAQAGIAAEDRALSLNPNYAEAMVYKNILLRRLANLEKDKAKQDALLKEADQLRQHALELQKKKASGSAG